MASSGRQPVRHLLERLAGGPISWGVCEVPGWGVELPPERVLGEMRELGLHATESGPDGYLGPDASAIAALLDRHGLRLVGGFVPLVLHEPSVRDETLAAARRTMELFAAAGAEIVCSAAVVDLDWSQPFALAPQQWEHLLSMLSRIDELAAEHGLTHALHPHWGTLVERDAEVQRVLERSDVRLCLDTGHLALGETDPVALARDAGGRVAHVHLKDVRGDLAAQLRAGTTALVPAVRAGLFRPLGDGDVPIADTVLAVEDAGYDGWYVLEQDTALEAVPADDGPAADVRSSIDFLRALQSAEPAAQAAEGR